MRTASQSPPASQIAKHEGWSKSGKQIIFQEGYEFNRKIIRELEKMIRNLKTKVKQLRRELDTVKGQQAIVRLRSGTSESRESEDSDQERERKRSSYRPAAGVWDFPVSYNLQLRSKVERSKKYKLNY